MTELSGALFPVTESLECELGTRVTGYLSIENGTWAYKMWFMTPQWWWDEDSGVFVKETRPVILDMMGE